MRLILLLILTLSATISPYFCSATNLQEVYQLALKNDPQLQAAYHANKSAIQALPQAIAAFFPSLTSTANVKGTDSTDPAFKRYNTWGYQLSITQPIIDFSIWNDLFQAQDTVKAAMATLAFAEQDLIVRTATQYFAILRTKDDLTFARSERKAFARHLEQMQQRFKVGLIAITDVHEAAARRDNAYAREVTAESALANEREKLRQITSGEILTLHTLKSGITLPKPSPANMENWVQTAIDQNWRLQASRYNLEVSRALINKEYTGHLPTVSLNANAVRSKAAPPNAVKSTAKDIELSLTLPIFSGGSVLSKTKEARENYEEAMEVYEQQYRDISSRTRQAYRNVLSKITQVNALKQTIHSTNSALKATKSAFDIGTRNIVDVLNAQSDVLNAERNLLKAYYEYILESLQLKLAAGLISASDIEAINQWLVLTKSTTSDTDHDSKDPTTLTEPTNSSTTTTPNGANNSGTITDPSTANAKPTNDLSATKSPKTSLTNKKSKIKHATIVNKSSTTSDASATKHDAAKPAAASAPSKDAPAATTTDATAPAAASAPSKDAPAATTTDATAPAATSAPSKDAPAATTTDATAPAATSAPSKFEPDVISKAIKAYRDPKLGLASQPEQSSETNNQVASQ